MTLATFILLALLQTPLAGRTIAGVVVDAGGAPIPGAVISLKRTTTLAITDEHGRFAIDVAAPEGVLVVAMNGFRTREVPVKPDATNGAVQSPLRIALELAAVTDEVVVQAPAVTSPPDTRIALRPLDVVRTAGTQADLMRALGVLPGVVQPEEAVGLFVRGGDVSETRVLLDSIPMNHPYRYETPTGGFRGAIDPFLTQGVVFTTGGFSAEYGNSLSGVVDMRGLARPAVRRFTGTAGLAGVAGAAAIPIGSTGGIRVSANRTTPQLLFAVNPAPRRFDQLPGGWDTSGSADLVTKQGVFHGFVLEQRDHVGVEIEQDAFTGFLHAGAEHRLVTATWQRFIGREWSINAAAGGDRYTSTTDVGVFAIAVSDRSSAVRVDTGGPIGQWQLRFGGETDAVSTRATGEVPRRGEDFGGVGGSRVFDVSHDDLMAGGYAEIHRTFGRFTPTAGVRADWYRHADAERIDPRLNLAIDLGGVGRARIAWGRYHQAPSPQYFDGFAGAVRLQPLSATHVVLGYELGQVERESYFRAEAYYKSYDNLPVENAETGFDDSGYGHATGVDLFYRRVWHFIDIRTSASLLSTERRWTSPNQQARYLLPDGTWTPDFSVPYVVQFIANVPISPTIIFGLAWRTAAGRPFTPVAGAIATTSGFEPVWGTRNSERLPRYARLDLSISKSHSFGGKGFAVFFASLDNATGRDNILEYVYSADYSERRPAQGAAPRSFYVGCSITR